MNLTMDTLLNMERKIVNFMLKYKYFTCDFCKQDAEYKCEICLSYLCLDHCRLCLKCREHYCYNCFKRPSCFCISCS